MAEPRSRVAVQGSPKPLLPMADPRNVAHDKKVMDEKRNHGEDPAEGAAVAPQPGRKPPQADDARDADSEDEGA